MKTNSALPKSLWKSSVGIAVSVLAVLPLAHAQLLSDPGTWNSDVMRGAKPTLDCATETIKNLRIRMSVSGPYSLDEFERTVEHFSTLPEGSEEEVPVYRQASKLVKERITNADRIFAFSFSTDPSSQDYWGFSGYLVARDDCVIHVEVTSYDN